MKFLARNPLDQRQNLAKRYNRISAADSVGGKAAVQKELDNIAADLLNNVKIW